MCIKIKGIDSEKKYDTKIPLVDQISDSHEVVISYDPKDKDIDHFIVEMEKLSKNGISANVKLNVSHNNSVMGLKAKKQMKRLTYDLNLNEAIKMLTNMQCKTDKTLEELAIFCKSK